MRSSNQASIRQSAGKLGATGRFCEWRAVYLFLLFCLATSLAGIAQTFTSLVSFDGGNGSEPQGVSLVQGVDGNFYGTTSAGGSSTGCSSSPGCGTIFKISTEGTLTTLYNFCGQTNCTDGSIPVAGLVLGRDGNFYGSTLSGGILGGNCTVTAGCGTMFKMTPDGTLTTLYRFCSKTGCADGYGPSAPLIQGVDGDLYGTTGNGGVSKPPGGTVFKITLQGALTTLYSFCAQSGCTDGSGPNAVLQGSDGNLYGSTLFGGLSPGDGTIFKVTTAGALTTLHLFHIAYPAAGLIQATDGLYYGTTSVGGRGNNCNDKLDCGTVFAITAKGAEKSLYSFCTQSGCPDGALPQAPLVQATDGSFYGTDPEGGSSNSVFCAAFIPSGCGTIFTMTASGSLTTLHTFDGTDGYRALDGLVQGTDGSFYGTTTYGGTSTNCEFGCGTVFSISVGLGPFVRTLPISGRVGTPVKILGTNLTGATGVSFNGTAATFQVVSSTEITTTVPSGATTGTVTVTTPSTKLNSNVSFRVLP